MINCNECGFKVNENMKFALMNNVCPSCGSSLFSPKDLNVLSTIDARMGVQRFYSKLDKELAYDISLFILGELNHGLGQTLLEEKISSLQNEEKAPVTREAKTPEQIRAEIEAEYIEQSEGGGITSTSEVDDDLESKVEKLKKLRRKPIALASDSKVNPRGKFGGVSRRS